MFVDPTGEGLWDAIKEGAKEAWNFGKKFVVNAWKSLDGNIGINTGFFGGVSTGLLGVNLGSYFGPSIILSDGEVEVGTLMRAEASISFFMITIGVMYDGFESYTDEENNQDSGWYFFSSSLNIASAAISFGVGIHYGFSFDLIEFIERMSEEED